MLSYSLKHEDAKTTRFEQNMYVDLAFVFIGHGNYTAARAVLETPAQRFLDREKELHTLQNRLLNRLDQKIRNFWKSYFQRSTDIGDSNR